MDNLKSWLERPENPTSYYELLGCSGFCNDRERLLAAVRAATRFLHPYENHKTSQIVRRARSLQLLCAAAGHTFSDDAKWHAYDDQLKLRLREEYFAQAPDADVRKWLLDKCGVASDRLDEIALFIVASDRASKSRDLPSSSMAPDSTEDIPPTPTPPRVGPPPLPVASSRPSHRPPPLPPRQPTNPAGHADTDPSETAMALEAVTMTLPAQHAAAVSTIQSAGQSAVAPPPPRMSGSGPEVTIQQHEHQQSAPVPPPLGRREKMALWLSGIFVAMAVVGVIVLLSLGQTSRKSTPHRQANQHESSNRELIEHGASSLAMIPSEDENRKD